MSRNGTCGRSTRRRFLATCGTVLAGATAGCTSSLGASDVEDAATSEDGPSTEQTCYSPEDSQFTDEERERALSTGTRLRESVSVVRGGGDRGGSTGGTAWHIGDGYFVTNGHVADPMNHIELYTLDGQTHTAELIDSSLDPDVAVLETDATSVPSVSVGDESALEAEQPVLHVGHPIFVGNWVISLGRFVRSDHFGVMTNVPSKQGYSGAPLATLEGDIVGLTTGAVPRNTDDSNDPEPDEDVVREDLTGHTYAHHVPVSVVDSRFDEWT